MFDSIGFIGAGRVTRIMLGGWQHKGVDLPSVYVFDQSPEAINSLKEFFPQVQSVSLSEVASKALVFVALHPPVIDEILTEIHSHLGKHSVLCSLAPKLRLSMLQEKLYGFDNLSRCLSLWWLLYLLIEIAIWVVHFNSSFTTRQKY